MRPEYLALLVLTLSAVCWNAHAEYLNLGPACIYIDMSCVPDPYVVYHGEIEESHGSLKCIRYSATIGHMNDVILELHKLEDEVNTSIEELIPFVAHFIPPGWSTDHAEFIVGGHRGVLINATDIYYPKMRLLCFSPDGDSGRGREILVASSTIRGNCSIDLFRSIRRT